MARDDIVKDRKIAAKLPKANLFHIEFFQWWLGDYIKAQSGWRPKFYQRMRYANAESFRFGPLCVTVARPWLIGPAQQLYPQLFDNPPI